MFKSLYVLLYVSLFFFENFELSNYYSGLKFDARNSITCVFFFEVCHIIAAYM